MSILFASTSFLYFFKQTKSNYEIGNLIDAANDIVMIKPRATPAEDLLHYQNEATISLFPNKIFAEENAKSVLKIKINEIKTNLKILNISPITM